MAALVFTDGERESPFLAPLVAKKKIAALNLASNVTWSLSSDFDATPFDGTHVRHLRAQPVETEAPRSPTHAAHLLRKALEGAVSEACGRAKRVAVLTGGGLDSGALLALATRHARLNGGSAFGVALDFPTLGDDRPYLRALEAQLSCEIQRAEPEAAGPILRELIRGVDASPVFCPTTALEVALVRRAKEHGAETVLMGVGGDQLFDGQPSAIATTAERGEFRRALNSLRRLRGFRRPRFAMADWVLRPLLSGLVPSQLRVWRARRLPFDGPSWAGPVIHEFERIERERQLEHLRHSRGALDSLILEAQRCQVGWVRHQESVAGGIPRRDPYFDSTLIAFVRSLPRDWLLFGDMRRGLFREAVRDLIPDVLLQREDKAAFEPALVRMLKASELMADELRRLASVPNLSRLGLVDAQRFKNAFAAFAHNPQNEVAWTDVWCALAVEAFVEDRGSA